MAMALPVPASNAAAWAGALGAAEPGAVTAKVSKLSVVTPTATLAVRPNADRPATLMPLRPP